MSQHHSSTKLDPACLWLTLVAGFGFSNIALFYGLTSYLALLGYDAHWQGLLFAAEPLAALVLRPWLGLWITPGRSVPTARLALALMAVALLGYGSITSLVGLFILRLTHGVAFVTLVSAVTIKLTRHITREQSAKAFYLFSLASLVPFAVVPVAAEWLMSLVSGEASLYAWSSVLCLPALAVLGVLPASPAAASPKAGRTVTARAMLAQVRGPILLLVAANGLAMLGISLAYCFLKPVLADLGLKDPALFFLLSSLASLLARLKGTALQARLSLKGLLTASLLGLGLTQILLGQGPGVAAVLALALAYGAFQGLALPLLNALMFNHSPRELSGVNSNLMLWSMDAAFVAGPVLGGILYPFGAGVLFAGCAGFTLFSVLLCLRVGAPEPAPAPAARDEA